MYSMYVFSGFDKSSENPIKMLPSGMLVGFFSIFLVKWLTPANYFTYDGCDLIYFEIEGNRAVFKYYWEMSHLQFEFLRNYIFTGLIEEVCKLSAGVLIFMLYKKNKMSKLFFYIVLSASFFAFLENLQYLELYGSSIVFVRCLVSTTTHVRLGLILGYFALKSLTYDSNKKFIFTMLLGLLISAFLHGSFNLSIYLELAYLTIFVWICIIVIGLICLNKAKKLI